jgi:glycosyltransferase involved in cell wall biosynthesis
VVERGRDPEALGRRTPGRREAARSALGAGADELVLLGVGRQEHQKGHVYLVEALHHLRESHPRAVVYLAGRAGNASAELDAAIDRRGLADRVRRLGHRGDVAELLVAADVFVMPSLYEGTAGAALEAMALEVPIVASDLAGTRGLLVHEDNALLVPIGEDVLLARAIGAALDDPAAAEARTSRGRAAFEARFTLERSAAAMVALYEDVVAR